MKTNLRCRSLFIALLMVVLIFNRPFAALAQQKSVEGQAKMDAEHDLPEFLDNIEAVKIQAKTVEGQAKMDAEHDAETDMNRKKWISAGIVSYGGMLLSGVVFSLGQSDAGFILSDRAMYAMLGMCVGGLVSGTLIYNYKLEPLPERFIGKPPVYIDVYTDTYKTKTRWLRMRWAGAGCAIVSGVGLLIQLVR